ncbi:DUF2269 family protein [Paenibacillus agricola]|uniref:DUF2269 family protein n=1 Tax=Paenibacillus agricola TaxID=2716264 RepID=UPI0028929D98|nr:DUF2269 family protein [Paenibacillus agricola]
MANAAFGWSRAVRWKYHNGGILENRADMTKNPAVIHCAVQNVMLADYLYTIPGLILIIVSGSIMAVKAETPMSGINWHTLSLILLAVTGIIWAAILISLQHRMILYSSQGIENGKISSLYRDASRNWAVFGTIATLLPLVIIYLMVMKGF